MIIIENPNDRRRNLMSKYIVTFDKSNEDIPTLVVSKESFFALGPGMDIIQVITGDEAINIWNKLSKKEGKDDN